MLIVLPPSEGKTAPRRGKPLALESLSSPSLTPARTQVVDALVELCASDPEKAAAVLDVPKSQLDLVDLNARLASSPTARADAVYTGVLYDALGFGTLTRAGKRRARHAWRSPRASSAWCDPVIGSPPTDSPATPRCPASARWPACGATASTSQ